MEGMEVEVGRAEKFKMFEYRSNMLNVRYTIVELLRVTLIQ